ncbi:hypothetical protein V5O48_001367 [Marasmius crinis-equi]|uniref:LD-carboxypeptidase n=1 Tax=Marasmius crinis-equi TaxID=585013 RepID=A0ABR3FYK8_9AGAR
MTAAAIRPPPINAGDFIRVIAPAGAVDAAALAKGTALLGSAPFGLQVRQDRDALLAVELYFAGSDDVRATSLLEAVGELSEIGNGTKAVWAARGGYGTARLIARVQDTVIPALKANPGWLVGYSDLTALIALWNRANVLALHGPMASNIQSFSQAARDATLSILRGTEAFKQTFNGSIRFRGSSSGQSVKGRLLGGNLSVLASLDFAGIVGIAVGQFVDGDTSNYTALQLLDLTFTSLDLPVITGLPIGHDTSTAMPLVLGAQAEIDLEAGQLIVDVPASSAA